ncbi:MULTISPECIES: TenA family protein [Actinoalloteichus]|uniref:Transcription activator n=1 Tax=Actinoalloteichus fjordicus TaxID=1612552 RepID=A0AAC9LA99_9PSEU|nr:MULTISPECIES: TenA family transcriptional regulator [Actinoalloteichus]APU14253.1 putative transcription activator [Actinoalloteichus fjordicus]APU20223.1 putative transcription activator [Actinoalloteichus sp. GBA129-24]
MFHEELIELAEPVLAKVKDHPFWSGLRDGTLPPECLSHFVEQDTLHLLPAYARALARTASAAPSDAHTALFGRSAFNSLEARDRLRAAYGELAPDLGLRAATETAPVDPATHAHSAFFAAASATSFVAGVGALLPMVWFNHQVSDDLLARRSSPRYAPWIEVYHPGEGYRYAVKGFLAMVDAVAEQASTAQRRELVEQFSLSIRYEWAFAETAWSRAGWPV